MFDYGSYQWNNRNRANLIYWRGLVIVGNELKNSYSSLLLASRKQARSRYVRHNNNDITLRAAVAQQCRPVRMGLAA